MMCDPFMVSLCVALTLAAHTHTVIQNVCKKRVHGYAVWTPPDLKVIQHGAPSFSKEKTIPLWRHFKL